MEFVPRKAQILADIVRLTRGQGDFQFAMNDNTNTAQLSLTDIQCSLNPKFTKPDRARIDSPERSIPDSLYSRC
jgi:hypothetical protein